MVESIITSEEAKEILKLVRSGNLTQLTANEALLKCFSTIKQMLPILSERASMDCVCLNEEGCSCGKSQAARIVKAVKSRPVSKTSRVGGPWC